MSGAPMRSGQLRQGGQIARSRVARIDWLLAHRAVWADLPSDSDDVTDLHRAALIKLGAAMVADGLYSKRTAVVDRTWGIRVLIGESRRQIAARA